MLVSGFIQGFSDGTTRHVYNNAPRILATNGINKTTPHMMTLINNTTPYMITGVNDTTPSMMNQQATKAPSRVSFSASNLEFTLKSNIIRLH